jgi:hypothetical protein
MYMLYFIKRRKDRKKKKKKKKKTGEKDWLWSRPNDNFLLGVSISAWLGRFQHINLYLEFDLTKFRINLIVQRN